MAGVMCPCCGQPVNDAGLSILKHIPLGGQAASLLHELVRVYPAGASHERMIDVLFSSDPQGGPEFPSQRVSVVMSRLRKNVRDLGWTIPVAYKNGVHRLVRL